MPQQRQAAETVLMSFKKTKAPYGLCQEIFEKSQCEMLLFEAADVMKLAIVAEWATLKETEKLYLRQY